jgi:branched-chain amino acid transport system permease protein
MIRRCKVCVPAAGVDIVWYKMWALALAGFLAGIARGVLAGGVGRVDGSAFLAGQSIMLFALTIVGCAYSWAGALLAGLLRRVFPALLFDCRVDGDIPTMLFGAGLLHTLFTARRGVAGQLGDGLGALRRLFDSATVFQNEQVVENLTVVDDVRAVPDSAPTGGGRYAN